MASMLLLMSFMMLAEARAHMPVFKWDTIPVFYHSANVTGSYNDAALRVLAKYPLVTFEKYQGPLTWSDAFREGTRHEEDNIAAVAKSLKTVNPDVAVLMYMHQWNYPWYAYRWELEGHPDWWAKDAKTHAYQMMDVPNINCTDGKGNTSKPPRCPMESVHVRDWNNSAAVSAWANACSRMVDSGLDGCFVDGVCDPSCAPGSGIHTGLGAMQKQVGQGVIVANGAYRGEYFPAAKGTMIESFTAAGKLGAFWVEKLRDAAQKGMLVEAHSHTCPPSEIDIAGFLVAAEEHSYFGCGPWYESVEGPQWFDLYGKPLGAPLGPASVVDKVWRRSFASGTNVTMDFNHMNATIQWADAHTQDLLV